MDASPNMDDSVDKHEPLWLADGLEDAFLGLMMHFNVLEPLACYDYDKVIEIFMEDGMTEEDAIEHFEYNVIGAWVGERTPCYVRRMTLEEAIDYEEESYG